MTTIKGYENYSITTDGRVWSKKRNKFLQPALNNSGYYRV